MTQDGKTKKIFDGRYEILSIVGRGASSVVYHARHAAPPVSNVALKVLLNKKGERTNSDRLRKEALAMVSSRHRYVIRLDDFHSVGELCYLSMEYAPESDLRKFSARFEGKLELPQTERFMLQAAEALGFIHRAGIIHRDIKPDNILVMNENEIRLGDFGVAVLPGEESSLEELQRGIGTMDYMAPEVLNGTRYDQRSDVYALGVTFYELFAQKHPFAGAPLMQQIDIRQDGAFADLATLAPAVPRYLSQVIMRAMSFDHEQRFATGREMLQAILVGKSEAEKQRIKSNSPASKAGSLQKKVIPPVAAVVEPIKETAPQAVVVTAPIEVTSQITTEVPHAESAPKEVPMPPQARERKKSLIPLTPRKPISEQVTVESTKSSDVPMPDDDFTTKETPIVADEDGPNSRVSAGRTRKRTSSHEGIQALATLSPSLPGIGIKSPTAPVISGAPGSVKLNDQQRRETKSMPPNQVGAAREIGTGKPTIKIPNESRPSALASSAMLGADNDSDIDDRNTPTIGFAGNAATEQSVEPNEQVAAADGIQGIQGRFKKISAPGAAAHIENLREKFLIPAMTSARGIKIEQPIIKRFMLGILAIAAVVVIAALFVGKGSSKGVHSTNVSASNFSEITANGISPVQSDAEIRFPELPSGMYVGKISGFIPNKDVPLTIISFPSKHTLSFLVGFPGWTPTAVTIPEKSAADDAPPIRVASNGIILEFTGQVLDGELNGYFRNLVTKENGSWEAAPVRQVGGAK